MWTVTEEREDDVTVVSRSGKRQVVIGLESTGWSFCVKDSGVITVQDVRVDRDFISNLLVLDDQRESDRLVNLALDRLVARQRLKLQAL
jgi:hypothetical protein